MAVAQLVLQDRSLSTKWAVRINDGQIQYQATSDSADSEPIFADRDNNSNHFQLYIEDGEMATESTVTVQDDIIVLEDETQGDGWRLAVIDEQFAYYFTALEDLFDTWVLLFTLNDIPPIENLSFTIIALITLLESGACPCPSWVEEEITCGDWVEVCT